VNAFLQELAHAAVYKRSQGRITRQVTWVAIAIVLALGLWQLSQSLRMTDWQWAKDLNVYGFYFWLPGALLVACLWIAYRLVNFPAFADFLIAVEAEMNKVSWPNRAELFRASMVVLITIIVLAAVLWGFDLFWAWFFSEVHLFPGASAETAMAGLRHTGDFLAAEVRGVT
jgi:preprotein translocase subunit SecE